MCLKEGVYKEPKLLKKIRTMDNPNGVSAISSDDFGNTVVVLPGLSKHEVQVYDTSVADKIDAFRIDEDPVCLAANINGGVFAHTDIKGYTIKLRRLNSGELIQTYNRGSEIAEVTNIAINDYCSRMAIASNKTTIHVFALPKEISDSVIEILKSRGSVISDFSEDSAANKKSSLLESRHGAMPGFFGRMLGKEGEYSYLKIYVDECSSQESEESKLQTIDSKIV